MLDEHTCITRQRCAFFRSFITVARSCLSLQYEMMSQRSEAIISRALPSSQGTPIIRKATNNTHRNFFNLFVSLPGAFASWQGQELGFPEGIWSSNTFCCQHYRQQQ